MKKRIKKRPIWQSFEEILGLAYEDARENALGYIERETSQDSETASLIFSEAWDEAFEYGEFHEAFKKNFNLAFEASLKAQNKIPKS